VVRGWARVDLGEIEAGLPTLKSSIRVVRLDAYDGLLADADPKRTIPTY
jgi:hypothetical protein